jgi:hypothetical protein
MTALMQMLVSPEAAADMIKSGACLAIAADEETLASLPCGNWIGGTISYFMGQNGGVTSRNQALVTRIPEQQGLRASIMHYDTASLSQICVDAPANGFSLMILPAFSDVHLEYAQNAPMYEDMYMKPLVGWISGIHLDDMGKRSPKVRDGSSKTLLEDQALVIHTPLPDNVSANVNIVNLFSQGKGDVLEFTESGFEASACLVNGETTSLAQYLKTIGHDSRLPLVADYSGALINVSLKSVDDKQDRVEFYGPVFPHVRYQLAQAFPGSYETAFAQAIADLPEEVSFSCNCILNYLYSGLEGKQTGHVTGPMTFGEVAYLLLNQTMVQLTLKTH